ncbi:MAG: dioxygenase [Robiginitomaculum sp.]|nr:MAG: dioxygenase [Robiginitomaculum sp.]
MSIIDRMDHFTILSPLLAKTRAFYEALGLTVGPRPDFPVAGLWLYAGDEPVLHIIEVSDPAANNGILDHMAFAGTDINALLKFLRTQEITYHLNQVDPPFAAWQVFFRDPNGAKVEIGFKISETPKTEA